MANVRSDAEVKQLYDKWTTDPYFSEYREELEGIKDDPGAIRDRFYRDPEFGTAGVRAMMGAGTARLNVPIVRLVSYGIARHILSEGEEAVKRGVMIGYDTRNNSALFAREAAEVFAGTGIKVYTFREPTPVPMVSYFIRKMNTEAGIMITASHNPKEYNGYKVYGSDGAQLSPEHSEAICREIEGIEDIAALPVYSYEKLIGTGMIKVFRPAILRRYTDTVIELGLDRSISAVQNAGLVLKDRLGSLKSVMKKLTVVYTPLHGAGARFVPAVLKRLGVEKLYTVKEQMAPNGDFPTVKVPNPENPEAFTMALELAKKVDADIILATDPDSDRTGAMIKTVPGEYRLLNGNQLGVILLNYILNTSLPPEPFAVSTIVSTRMAEKLCAAKGVKYIDVLTGFKYIGEQIEKLEDNGTGHFIFGFEESYGYLAGSYARDKDAVASCMLLCIVAAKLKAVNRSMADALRDVYNITGCWYEFQISKVFPGESGTAQMARIMSEARRMGAGLLKGETPVEILDVQTSERVCYDESGKEVSRDKLDYPVSNVLRFTYKDFWFCLRPSGTEPKIKLYFGAQGDSYPEASNYATRVSERVLGALETV